MAGTTSFIGNDLDGSVHVLTESELSKYLSDWEAIVVDSHTPTRPKWHVQLPFATHWSGPKIEWRYSYRHAVGWFSAAAGLAVNPSKPSDLGFDIAPDRLGQPWFLTARRNAEQAAPELICRDGLALDGERFEELTGLELAHDDPATALSLTVELVRRDKGWTVDSSQEKITTVLRAALSDIATREAATTLIHELGARGHIEFRVLLETPEAPPASSSQTE
jgi:hypothetical protein